MPALRGAWRPEELLGCGFSQISEGIRAPQCSGLRLYAERLRATRARQRGLRTVRAPGGTPAASCTSLIWALLLGL